MKQGDDKDDGGRDRTADFVARMEAAERNKQKKLEMTRGEKEYQSNMVSVAVVLFIMNVN